MPFPVALALMGVSALGNAIRGGVQGSKARKLESDFAKKDAALQPVSPDQYAQLARARQLERSMRVGTDPSSQFANYGLRSSLGQTQNNIVRAGGGAGTVNSLLRSETGYNQGMANVGAQAANNANQMFQYQGGLVDNIQNSIYGLQMKRRNYAQALAAQQRQAATDSMTAAIGSLAQAATMVPSANPKIGQDAQRGGVADHWLPRQGEDAPWYATAPQSTYPAQNVGNYMADTQEPFVAPPTIE